MSYVNMSVRGKLLAGFSILLALMVVVAVTALGKMSSINDGVEILLKERYAKVKLTNEVEKHASEVGRVVRSAILADSDAEIESDIEHAEQLRKLNAEALDKIKAIGLHPGSKGVALFEKAQTLRGALGAKYAPLYALIRKHDAAGARAYLKSEWIPANNSYMATLDEYVAYNDGKMDEEALVMEDAYKSSRIAMVAALLTAIALGVGIALYIAANLSSRIAVAVDIAARIADGDLRTQSLSATESKDEVGRLLASLEAMRANLVRTVRDVVAEASNLSSSATQLSAAAQQVAASTENQSQSTASAAAAVEELTVSIEHVGSNAGDARQRAIDAGNSAVASGTDVRMASDQISAVASSVEASASTIHDLSAKVQEIDNITTVIREVADQTNLLALNAAIEAARAGEQGRGFAVVADEVRKLAERTSLSVQEITAMIAAIQHGADSAVASMRTSRDVVAGVVTAATRAGESMTDIQAATVSVQDAVVAIADALLEQRTTSSALATNVESIAQMSEENSAAVAAVAETAQGLSASSAKLQACINYFKV